MQSKSILQGLTQQEQAVIGRALSLILTGRYIPDWDLHPRLGVTREELTLVNARFPYVEQVGDEETVVLSIHNALNEVCYALSIPEKEWEQWFGSSRNEVRAIFEKWLAGEKRP